MSMQDPISDMLTRIRNGQSSRKRSVSIPSSRIKKAIANVLLEEGYIESYKADEGVKPELLIVLKYFEGQQVIAKIERASKPSRRVYRGWQEIPSVLGGLGIAILSTSQGIMSNKRAQSRKLGGEILCYVA